MKTSQKQTAARLPGLLVINCALLLGEEMAEAHLKTRR
jgi:hypothetical protein